MGRIYYVPSCVFEEEAEGAIGREHLCRFRREGQSERGIRTWAAATRRKARPSSGEELTEMAGSAYGWRRGAGGRLRLRRRRPCMVYIPAASFRCSHGTRLAAIGWVHILPRSTLRSVTVPTSSPPQTPYKAERHTLSVRVLTGSK
jgi:hypothetical protein